MAKLSILAGATSQTVNVFIQNSGSTTGAGLTGLAFGSSGLTAYYVLPAAASAVITLVTQTVTGAFSSGGFKEIDSTNCPGLYRLDLPNAAIASGRFSTVYLQGATGMAPCVLEIELTGWNNQDAVHGGLSALPNTACTTNASLLTSGTGTDQVSNASGRVDVGKTLGTAVTLDSNNVLNVSTKYVGGTLQTARDIGLSVLLSSGTGTGQLSLSSGLVTLAAVTHTGARIPNVTLADTVTTYTGNTPQTGDNYARIGAAGAGLTALGDTRIGNLDVAVSTRTKPADTQAAVTTVTNLTNAPTAGDLTATMKTSVTTAATAATPTAAAVTAAVTVTGDLTSTMKTSVTTAATAATPTAAAVTGAVGSVTAGVTVTTNNDKTGYADTAGTTTLLTRIPGTVVAQTGDAYARLGAPAGASVSADVAALKTDLDAGVLVSGAGADAILDRTNGVETSITLRQAQRVQLAAAAGKVDGAATTTVHLRNQADTKNRVTATVDSSGNRSAITLDLG